MRVYSLLISSIILFSSCVASSQSSKDIYKLPESSAQTVETAKAGGVIAGAASGLYRITSTKTAIPLWNEGKVWSPFPNGQQSTTGYIPLAGLYMTGSHPYRNRRTKSLRSV